ncbi:acyl-CoA thioesterase [Paenibacillus glycanilyticus]|uniref:acyl-CoA thioesterase n=1 Tax=Paenibacillus glycanilyticus TaxID=126569 RepID=UPI00203CF665|nr:acyl-CoA thioesterase [Paenibacillus glycanilyticus]MCM3629951.1 acyl-CoA thioesterase [Paenibacillus glycanilyticus]
MEKPASASRTVMTQIIFPLDTNHHETMFGGKVMEYMDKAAAIAAMRHARMQVVTASTDSLDFVAPIKVGEVIEVEAYVTWTHDSSMEVCVTVQSENLYTAQRTTTVTAFFTFVALNDQGRPTKVPKVYPETNEEIHMYATAPERYELRMKRKRERQHAAKT